MKNLKFNISYLLALFVLFLNTPITDLHAQNILIESGSVWKYLDDGSDQGELWREIDFDDSSWKTGNAQFGYGDGDETTLLNFGPDSSSTFATYYFRKSFEVEDSTQFLSVSLELLRDDAAVVFLNGIEILRSNLSLTHRVHYGTRSRNPINGAAENQFIDSVYFPSNILQGKNVLAVEVHQSKETSDQDLSFDLRLTSASVPDLTYKEPYLIFNGKSSEMQVLWQAKRSIKSTISWGLDTNYSTGSIQTEEYGNDHQHSYTIKDLIPSTKYFYKVQMLSEIHTGSFKSAPEENSSDLKFLAYGDTRSYPNDHDMVAASIANTFKDDEEYQTILLGVGDYVNNGDLESEWDEQFFSLTHRGMREMMSNIPLQAAIGNHERSAVLFKKYYPYPYVSDRYWSFDYGPAHFVIVDQYSNYSINSNQLNWIESDLKASNKPWKFIILHQPGWTAAGGHGNDEDVQKYIQPLCIQFGVSIVFGGHNHYYSRAVVNGIQHLTIGGGGAPLRDPEEGQPNVVIINKSFHFSKIEIKDDLLTCEIVKPSGEIIETFTVDKVVSVESDNKQQIIKEFKLFNAYPNPFNPTTKIDYQLPHDSFVNITVYNAIGQEVSTLVNQHQNSGKYSVIFDARNFSSGIYFYKLKAGNYTDSKTIVLTK